MHSKWKIWDYLKNFPDGFDSSKTGIFAFSCNDTLISSLIKSSFPKNYFHENKLYSMAAKEISVQWFEDNFQTLGLFGNQASYIFNNANQLSAQLKNQSQLDNNVPRINNTAGAGRRRQASSEGNYGNRGQDRSRRENVNKFGWNASTD